MNDRTALIFAIALGLPAVASYGHDEGHDHDHAWLPMPFADAEAYAPTPVPDRVVLTWNGDTATTQAVTWRTDVSVQRGVAEIALANDNGRAMQPARFESEMAELRSDLGEARYHTVTFSGLEPDTLYAYRVGDGANWSEYFHFRTASREARPLASSISATPRTTSRRTGPASSAKPFAPRRERRSCCTRATWSTTATATRSGASGMARRPG